MERFDRIVLGTMAGLAAAIGLVVAIGERSGVRVLERSPRPDEAPPVTTVVRITFSEEMDSVSVAGRFAISPAVDGAITWDTNTLIFAPDTAFTPGQAYSVTLLAGAASAAGRVLSETVTWTFRPRAPGILYLAPADEPATGLWRASPGGGEPQQVLEAQGEIVDFAPAPDGAYIAVTLGEDGASDIWLFGANGGRGRRLTDCAPSRCANPAWSPDGRWLAFERWEESALPGFSSSARIWLADVDSGSSTPVFEDAAVVGVEPCWSRDGSQLAFYDAVVGAIRVVSLATGQLVLVPSQMGEAATFDVDGSRVAFSDIRPVGRQVFPQVWIAVLGEGGGLSPLREDAQEDRSPAWSPDGRWIAFASRRLDRQDGVSSQLMLFDTLTSEVRQVTDDPQVNHPRFAWDPTGTRLLVQRYVLAEAAARAEVWVLDLPSGALTRVADNAFGGQWIP
jgi:Tol biopolymer transport system component